MKHLEKYDKEIIKIEDILLEFTDTGSINLIKVKRLDPNEIRISLTINQKYSGQKRNEFIDYLSAKIRRRYPNIRIIGQNIHIYLERTSQKNYFTTVENRVLSTFNKMFGNGNYFTINTKDYISFIDIKSRLVSVEYDKLTKTLYYAARFIVPYDVILVSSDSQEILIKKYFSENNDIKKLDIENIECIRIYKMFKMVSDNQADMAAFHNGTISMEDIYNKYNEL